LRGEGRKCSDKGVFRRYGARFSRSRGDLVTEANVRE